MLRTHGGTPRVWRTAFAVLLGTLAGMLAVPATSLAAKETWFSGFSSIVVDAKTGEVIDSDRADELRHPASLAKIMTLYLLFAELESGRLKLDSKMRVSANAAKQPPSKLGLKAGQTIEVEDAIKAIVTRSGNDVAVTIAEAIAGDEDSFATLMTRRAPTLGMTRTVFKNASGLPDPEQVTTAREMALLGLAMQDRFPKYYPYFAVRKFRWRGAAIGNHNRLLGRVEGVDGIKTGYTRASGFNLVSNVKRDGRHIVAVVMGGRTGAARDAAMRNLIAAKIRHAHAGPRLAPRFAEKPVPMPVPSPLTTAAAVFSPPATGSTEPVRRSPVRTVAVNKNGEIIEEGDSSTDTLPISTMSPSSVREPIRIVPTALAPDGKIVTFAPPPPPPPFATASAQTSPEIERAAVVSALAPEEAQPAEAPAEQEIASAPPPERSGWIIQIGAYPKEAAARERLAEALERAANSLAKGSPYTEKTSKGSTELYRARFAGFDETSAKRACETLKKNDFACFVARN